MKLRTLSFNKTVFKKDITRFAPLWAIYFIGGMLVMLSLFAGNQTASANAKDLAQTIAPLSIVNMIYAALCAQVLFGDLYNSRLCNALHAMPMRREGWFLTHVISGLAFSFVPHLVAALVMMPMLGELWFVGLIWLAGLTLEYLFFFGLAVFSVFCTGNRLGMAAVYGILNFASVIAYWFVYTIYEPMLFGVSVPEDPFLLLSPVVQMCSNHDLLKFAPIRENIAYYLIEYIFAGFQEGWGYLGICAGLGVVLTVLALLLYRRRKLECAGDFLAVKALEPIFTAAFTLCAGCVFAFVGELFASDYLVFLIVGLILGWFVSRMLLRRTVKVFHWKTFAWLGVFLAVLGGSMVLTWLDPVGITRWVPEANAVSKVEVSFGNEISIYGNDYVKVEDPEQIERILKGHQDIVDNRKTGDVYRRTITLRYTLKSGVVAERRYDIYPGTEMMNALRNVYSTPKNLLGHEDKEAFKSNVTRVFFNGDDLQFLCDKYNDSLDAESGKEKVVYSTVLNELLDALWADCETGNVTQRQFVKNENPKDYIELEYEEYKWREVVPYAFCDNYMEWLAKYYDMIKLVSK